MKAIIPVAGSGRRLKPLTHTMPKPLLNVAGKPILGHILDELIDVGVDHVILVVGRLGERIQEYVREHYDIRADFVEQKEPQGIGHAVYQARELVRPDEPVLILLGDTIFKADFEAVLSGSTSAVGVRAVEDPSRFGVAVVEDHMVTRLVEKPETPVSNLALVGIYYFARAGILFEALRDTVQRGESEDRGRLIHLTDALELMIRGGERLRAVTVNGWFDCGEAESLLRTNRFLLDQSGSPAEIRGSIVVGPVAIHPSARVVRSVVGPYATVSEGASIIDSIVRDTIINDDAVVENCLLRHSLVGEEAVVRGTFQRLNVGDSAVVEFH